MSYSAATLINRAALLFCLFVMENGNANISIIIPTRNEAVGIETQIKHLLSLPGAQNCEVMVCDGASADSTREISERAGARVLLCQSNRGAQLNAGAQASNGKVLWFLHADSRPHARSLEYLQRAMQKPRVCGGNFRLCFNSDQTAARIFESIARMQRRRGVYYGDSGIWVRREIFDRLVGFREWPLFEDYDFARRLEAVARRQRQRTDYAPLPICASARRFEKAPLRVLSQWAILQLLFSLSVSPGKLAQLYFTNRD